MPLALCLSSVAVAGYYGHTNFGVKDAVFLQQAETELDKTLLACDELTGLITATALVRPEGIDDLTPKSVKKKMKDPTFAKGVDREEVKHGCELLGVELDTHIQNVIDAIRAIAPELGLTGAQIRR